MTGYLVTSGTSAKCPHSAAVSISAGQSRVTVAGNDVAVSSGSLTVSACQFKVPVPGGTKPQPCTTVTWNLTGSRVTVDGKKPLLLPQPGTGPAICKSADGIPAGPPPTSPSQQRVQGA
ncbi:hypothetical protein ACQP2F_18965 [Actinoplanes sp. CA-030573]|uniref:hypothetical protein n=1 Tax=Actinoplanes sp. CA-030573 TaxID=3239898 RepID=UPI003D9333E3